MDVTFSIPDDNVEELTTAIAARHPIPTHQVLVEEADPEEETEAVYEEQPEFTKGQWAKEYTRRLWKRIVKAHRKDVGGNATEDVPDDFVS